MPWTILELTESKGELIYQLTIRYHNFSIGPPDADTVTVSQGFKGNRSLVDVGPRILWLHKILWYTAVSKTSIYLRNGHMNYNFELFKLIAIYNPYPLFSHQYALPQYIVVAHTPKIINRVYFAMQSPYFHNFRRRHEV